MRSGFRQLYHYRTVAIPGPQLLALMVTGKRETIMSNLVNRVKKAAVGALALAVISTGFTAVSATSADAQWRPRPAYGNGYRHRGNRGAAVAAGLLGGLVVGGLIAGSSRAYAQPGYGYAQPGYGYAPVYSQGYGYEPAYQPTCYTRKVRQVVDYDTVVIRRVRVCE
jgi:hypothetical protein